MLWRKVSLGDMKERDGLERRDWTALLIDSGGEREVKAHVCEDANVRG